MLQNECGAWFCSPLLSLRPSFAAASCWLAVAIAGNLQPTASCQQQAVGSWLPATSSLQVAEPVAADSQMPAAGSQRSQQGAASGQLPAAGSHQPASQQLAASSQLPACGILGSLRSMDRGYLVSHGPPYGAAHGTIGVL